MQLASGAYASSSYVAVETHEEETRKDIKSFHLTLPRRVRDKATIFYLKEPEGRQLGVYDLPNASTVQFTILLRQRPLGAPRLAFMGKLEDAALLSVSDLGVKMGGKEVVLCWPRRDAFPVLGSQVLSVIRRYVGQPPLTAIKRSSFATWAVTDLAKVAPEGMSENRFLQATATLFCNKRHAGNVNPTHGVMHAYIRDKRDKPTNVQAPPPTGRKGPRGLGETRHHLCLRPNARHPLFRLQAQERTQRR